MLKLPRQNLENAVLRAQMVAQAHALQDTSNGLLLSISAALQSVVNAQQEAQRIHAENQRAQQAYQDDMQDIVDILSKRQAVTGSSRLSTPLPLYRKISRT